MTAALVFFILLLIVLVIFTLQNSTVITVKLFVWEFSDVPLALLLLSFLLAGFLIGAFNLFPRIWRQKKEIKRLRKQNEKLTGQLAQQVPPPVEKPAEKPTSEGFEMERDGEDGFFDG